MDGQALQTSSRERSNWRSIKIVQKRNRNLNTKKRQKRQKRECWTALSFLTVQQSANYKNNNNTKEPIDQVN